MKYKTPASIVLFLIFCLLTYSSDCFANEYPRKASDFFKPFNPANLYFLIDSKGNKIKQINCRMINDFSEGLCAVSGLNSKSHFVEADRGYIDTKGDVVIPGQFSNAGDFKSGIAFAKSGEGPCYIDKTGKVLFKIGKYSTGFKFNEGLAPFFYETEDLIGAPLIPSDLRMRYGYIDRKGKVAIPAEFTWAVEFYEGRAAVRDKEGKWFLIDKKGNQIGRKYQFVSSVSDGMAAVLQDKKWGYIDVDGKEVIPLKFAGVDKFSESLAFVANGIKCGVIDKKGKFVIEPRFKNGGHFVNAKSPAQNEDGKWGYIDTSGNFVIKPIYDLAEPFSSGRAVVKVDNKVGYIDESGNYVVEPIYKAGKPFHGEVAIVTEGPPDSPRRVVRKAKKTKFWQFWNNSGKPGEFDIASDAPGWHTSSDRIKSSPDRKYILVNEPLVFRRNGMADRLNLMDGNGENFILRICSEIKPEYKERRSEIHGFSWSPDSKAFAWAETSGVYLFDLDSTEKKRIDAFKNGTMNCLWSPDGKYIAAGEKIVLEGMLQTLKVYDVAKDKIVFDHSGSSYSRLAWSPDGKYLIFSGEKVEIFEPGKNWKLVSTFEEEKLGPMVWSPDSNNIAFSDFNSSWVRIYDKSAEFVNKYPAKSATDISWSNDGKTILARNGFSNDKYTKISLLFDKEGKLASAPKEQIDKDAKSSSSLAQKYKDEWFAKPGPLSWGYGWNKVRAFEKIATTYPLIGMKRSDLLDLLGTPGDEPREFFKDSKEITYRLQMTGCINQGVWLIFDMENDRVKRWTKATTLGKEEWVTENVKSQDSK